MNYKSKENGDNNLLFITVKRSFCENYLLILITQTMQINQGIISWVDGWFPISDCLWLVSQSQRRISLVEKNIYCTNLSFTEYYSNSQKCSTKNLLHWHRKSWIFKLPPNEKFKPNNKNNQPKLIKIKIWQSNIRNM